METLFCFFSILALCLCWESAHFINVWQCLNLSASKCFGGALTISHSCISGTNCSPPKQLGCCCASVISSVDTNLLRLTYSENNINIYELNNVNPHIVLSLRMLRETVLKDLLHSNIHFSSHVHQLNNLIIKAIRLIMHDFHFVNPW